jgi:KUP system potassium uptake protein
MSSQTFSMNRVTPVGLLITLGIIFGDIGTSPLYVMKAVIGKSVISEELVLGGLSCVLWTLTLLTTLKYVVLTLRADNKGEGGIFALYALLKRLNKKWLIFPAIIGGSTLLADGLITPPISVASAVEGLHVLSPGFNTIPVVIAILSALFFIQQFGTRFIGKFFGPVMLIWFSMLAVLGVMLISGNPGVLKAVNPLYAWKMLTANRDGFWLLSGVFLCTTGAEALYSDLGHCGKKNVRISWTFVKVALLLNYFGQGAWLLGHEGELLSGRNPFYALMDAWFLPVGIFIATAATIVASQALISGSFTLINEAIRLNFWPKVKIKYPTEHRGQVYIPSINWLLCAGCLGMVLFFRESTNMEAAYGLSIVMTMIMTTLLLVNFLVMKRYPQALIWLLLVVYLLIETAFLVANLGKFQHGGYVTVIIAAALVGVMVTWYQARKIMNRYLEFTKLSNYLPVISGLSADETIKKYATHLVYLTSADRQDEIEQKIIYSILQKQPKRADIYWFVHIDLVDEPYCLEYKVIPVVAKKIIRVEFRLGFREIPRVNLLFRQVVSGLAENGEVDITSRYASLHNLKIPGDFTFVVMKKFLSYENELPLYEKVIMHGYFLLKKLGLSEEKAFGLDTSNVAVEGVPFVIRPPKDLNLKRIL